MESPQPPACYSAGAYVSGAIHRVVFGAGDEGPLPPATRVYYRVGKRLGMAGSLACFVWPQPGCAGRARASSMPRGGAAAAPGPSGCPPRPALRACHLPCRAGDPARGWSEEFSFKTAPLVGPGALPYRLGVLGDLGQSDHSLRCGGALPI